MKLALSASLFFLSPNVANKTKGILSINHVTDKVLQHSAPEVVIARAGWFQENWATAFETLNTSRPFFHSIFTPIDYKIAMVWNVMNHESFSTESVSDQHIGHW